MALEFIYGYSMGLGYSKAVVDPVNEHLFEVKVGREHIGDYPSVPEALAALALFLRGEGKASPEILGLIEDVRYWDRFYVGTYEAEEKK